MAISTGRMVTNMSKIDQTLADIVAAATSAQGSWIPVPTSTPVNMGFVESPKLPRANSAVGCLVAALARPDGSDLYDLSCIRMAATRNYSDPTCVGNAVDHTAWYLTQGNDRGSLPNKGWILQCRIVDNPTRVVYRIVGGQQGHVDRSYVAKCKDHLRGHMGAARTAVSSILTSRAGARCLPASGATHVALDAHDGIDAT